MRDDEIITSNEFETQTARLLGKPMRASDATSSVTEAVEIDVAASAADDEVAADEMVAEVVD